MHKRFLKKCEDNKIYDENIKLLRRIINIDRCFMGKNSEKNMPRAKSLNRNFRRQVDEKIMNENRSFVSRIMNVKSIYDIKSWEKDHNKHLVLTQNISKERSKIFINF